MAAKAKRKTTTRRKGPAKAKAVKRTNPARSLARKRTFGAKRKAVRRVKRRSNPSLTSGLGATAITAFNTVLAMTGIGLVTPMIPQILGPSPLGRAAQVGAVGWGGGYVAKRFGASKVGDALQLAGAVLGASIVIEAYVAPMIRGFMQPAPPPAPRTVNGKQLGDLVTLPAGRYDPYYGTTPNLQGAAQQGATLGDLVTMRMYPGAY